MNEKHGYTLEVGDVVRFYYGRGKALDRAVRVGARLAITSNRNRFSVTDMISAATTQYRVIIHAEHANAAAGA